MAEEHKKAIEKENQRIYQLNEEISDLKSTVSSQEEKYSALVKSNNTWATSSMEWERQVNCLKDQLAAQGQRTEADLQDLNDIQAPSTNETSQSINQHMPQLSPRQNYQVSVQQQRERYPKAETLIATRPNAHNGTRWQNTENEANDVFP